VPARPPESGRSYPLARPLLLIGWTLVLWGTLVAGALVWRSLQVGPLAAVLRLVSGTSSISPTVGCANLACAIFAVCVWGTLAALLLRREDRED
jgi:hypothetical protein